MLVSAKKWTMQCGVYKGGEEWLGPYSYSNLLYWVERYILQISNMDGFKTYLCEYCGKFFYYQFNFKRHFLSHQKDAAVGNLKVFNCSLCPASFAKYWNLQCHINSIHNSKSVECSKCHKTFTRKQNRDLHEDRCTIQSKSCETHTTKKVYLCKCCGLLVRTL